MAEAAELAEMTADIVSAYVSNAKIEPAELPALIKQVHASLSRIASNEPEMEVVAPLAPAVSLKKSITPDHLICLEDGRKFKSLKRHLRTKYDLSPDQYRAKWGLPKIYPMVAPNYAAARSNLAKQMGLGQGGRKPAPATAPKAARGRARPAKVVVRHWAQG
jgi:predicted transcriptional regulator